MTDIVIIFLILCIIMKELIFVIKLRIHTKKRGIEYVVVIIGMTAIAIITYCFEKSLYHDIFGLLGVALIYLLCFKQGISETGIMIAARGKEYYKWAEIACAEILRSDTLFVTYYATSGSIIVRQCYLIEDEEKILALLRTHTKVIDHKDQEQELQ